MCFHRHSKFSSFQRQLNLYQFRKIVKGPDAGGYQHPMFHRDRPEDLCHVRRSVSGSGAGAKATATKRNGAAAAAASKQAKGDGAGWAPQRAHKSGAAVRRVGKLRNKAVTTARDGRNPRSSMISPSFAQLVMAADHNQQQTAVAPAAAAAGGGGFSLSAEVASSDAGERSPWTSGESSDSDVSIAEAATGGGAERSARKGAGKNTKEPRRQARGRGADDSCDDDDDDDDDDDVEGILSSDVNDSDDDGEGDTRSMGGGRRRALNSEPREELLQERRFSCAALAEKEAGGEGEGAQQQQQQVEANDGGGGGQRATASTTARKSPFNFFKKTFSFMDRVRRADPAIYLHS